MAAVQPLIFFFSFVTINSVDCAKTIDFTPWITSSYRMPEADFYTAVGYHNGSFYLFGGYTYRSQLVEFTGLSSTTFITHNPLTQQIYGSGQFYTQINEILYWIDFESGDVIIAYDLSQQTVLQSESISIPQGVLSASCLASHNNLLFVVGGGWSPNALDTLQVYSITAQLWFSGLSSMEIARSSPSCIVHPKYNMLYVIGGRGIDDTVALKSIERIHVTDIANRNWQPVDDMPQRWRLQRSVIYYDSILIFGGQNEAGTLNDDVYSIDMDTNSVSTVGSLDYGMAGPAAIFITDHIYLFGGGVWPATGTDKWQYLVVGTLSPTSGPTEAPISNPTMYPTITPSNNPSKTPTEFPSETPSKFPSETPSKFPSETPISSPTNSQTTTVTPTEFPSVTPTESPTKSPSKPQSTTPTQHPTTSPTSIPSMSPLGARDGRSGEQGIETTLSAPGSSTNVGAKGDSDRLRTVILSIFGSVIGALFGLIFCLCVALVYKYRNAQKRMSHISQKRIIQNDNTFTQQNIELHSYEKDGNAIDEDFIDEFMIVDADGNFKTKAGESGLCVVDNEGDHDIDDVNGNMEKSGANTAGFKESLVNKALGSDLLMNDIVADMAATPN